MGVAWSPIGQAAGDRIGRGASTVRRVRRFAAVYPGEQVIQGGKPSWFNVRPDSDHHRKGLVPSRVRHETRVHRQHAYKYS
jgi:hypothetical protein